MATTHTRGSMEWRDEDVGPTGWQNDKTMASTSEAIVLHILVFVENAQLLEGSASR